EIVGEVEAVLGAEASAALLETRGHGRLLGLSDGDTLDRTCPAPVSIEQVTPVCSRGTPPRKCPSPHRRIPPRARRPAPSSKRRQTARCNRDSRRRKRSRATVR